MAFASTSNLNKTLLNNDQTITSNLNTSQSINDNNNQLKIASNNTREDDEWIAVKSLDRSNSVDSNIQHNIVNLANNEIINIVSISVEKEKISIVTREHNRLVTDDENTKQWYGVYTIEQLYLINKRMCELDPNLDEFYPEQLRPIKGILSTYFTDKLNSLDTTEDLQDNRLCNAFSLYLNKAFQSLGKRLYIDILFDDVNSDQYFEIYSEFNLKRIQNQIEKLKQQLFPISINNISKQSSQQQIHKVNNLKLNNSSLNELIKKQNEEYELQHKLLLKQQIFSNLKHVLNSYSNEDNQIEVLVNLYAEYYGNLLQPLSDSLEIAKINLNKYTTKLINQEKSSKLFATQSTANALVDLKNNVDLNKNEILQLSSNIDSINIEYKQNLIDLYKKLLNKLKLDRDKFIQTSLGLDLSSLFDILTKKRKEKLNDHIAEFVIQTYNLQLGLIEKKKENENNITTSKLNDINKKIIKLKLQLYSEEEIVLKRKLNKLNEDETVIELKEKQLKNLLNESTSDYTDFKIEEIKEIISKIDLNNFVHKEEEFDYDLTCDSEDEDDESDFHDTYDDPLVLMQVEAKEKQVKQNEINAIKKKITDIGSKKSALRINLSILNEADKIKQENEAEKMNETDKLNQTNISIKSVALKKQEDEIQSRENLENRRKALQRIREHKSKHMKDSMFSSSDSLVSVNTTSTIKKPYVPKSKQRILPPPPKPRQSKSIEFKNSITFEVKLNDLDEITKLDDEIKSSNLINTQQDEKMLSESEIFNFKPSISSSVNINNETMASSSVIPAPPPPPPLPSFMTSSTNNLALPLSNLPPPPPPPPLPSSFLTSSITISSTTTEKLSIQNTPPVPLLFSSESFKNELKLAKTTPKSTKNNQLKPIDNSSKHNRSFDLNEIKNFKFKPVKVNVKERPSIDSQNKNPWDNLMNEIRSNGGNKLKKVSDSTANKSSKQMKFNNDDNLVRDLNQILSQRSQFFKDDDDNESSDDESWNGFINS